MLPRRPTGRWRTPKMSENHAEQLGGEVIDGDRERIVSASPQLYHSLPCVSLQIFQLLIHIQYVTYAGTWMSVERTISSIGIVSEH